MKFKVPINEAMSVFKHCLHVCIGVVSCFRQCHPHVLRNKVRPDGVVVLSSYGIQISGASAGASIALSALIDMPLGRCRCKPLPRATCHVPLQRTWSATPWRGVAERGAVLWAPSPPRLTPARGSRKYTTASSPRTPHGR